ncbi:MAG: hypothetical protein DRJ51_06200 [Thermoprotei archaeon]|nr:MAG: hypothetical protein DRJ51_06200 [Thermoprotei archaeon]RLF02330.1 MAG: hypothetical protein DRJ59_03895 [Thermoprotei archaeon]
MRVPPIVTVTRHCLKRVLERAQVYDRIEGLKLVEKVLREGEIVDERGRHLLVKLGKHYIILRRAEEGYLAVSYTIGVVPRGFTERLRGRRFEPGFTIKLARSRR